MIFLRLSDDSPIDCLMRTTRRKHLGTSEWSWFYSWGILVSIMRRVVKDVFSYFWLILQRRVDKTVLNLRGPGYATFIFWTFTVSHTVGCWCYFDPCISSWSNFSSIIPNGAFRPQFSEGSLSICRLWF